MTEELMNWLILWQAFGIRAQKSHELLQHYGSVGNVIRASTASLVALGVETARCQRLKHPDDRGITQAIQWLEESNHHIVTYQDAHYPILLKQITDPPLLLFIAGDPGLLSAPQLAVVGSRNPTPSGMEMTAEFVRYLSSAGLVITSGLALGIDAAAHESALASKGKTIAVMGTGLDEIYPRCHDSLANEIVEKGGALISEFPLGAPAKPEHFPLRNRLISGLSLGTLVVEAALRSGSLITARLAAEQGREVFTLPGSIHNPLARGCHQLIKEGATLVETAEEILQELGPLSSILVTPCQVDSYHKPPKRELEEACQKLLQYIGFEVTSIDLLVDRSGFAVGEIASLLLTLELSGYIQMMPGGYIRVK